MVLEHVQANCLLCQEEDGVVVESRYHAPVSADAGQTVQWMPLCTIHAKAWADTARDARREGAWWARAPELRGSFELTWQQPLPWYVTFTLTGSRVFTWSTQVPPIGGVERAVAEIAQHLIRVAGVPSVGFVTMYKEALCQL